MLDTKLNTCKTVSGANQFVLSIYKFMYNNNQGDRPHPPNSLTPLTEIQHRLNFNPKTLVTSHTY